MSDVSWAQRERWAMVNIINAMMVIVMFVKVVVMAMIMVTLDTMDAADRGGARGGAMRAWWTLAMSTAL